MRSCAQVGGAQRGNASADAGGRGMSPGHRSFVVANFVKPQPSFPTQDSLANSHSELYEALLRNEDLTGRVAKLNEEVGTLSDQVTVT